MTTRVTQGRSCPILPHACGVVLLGLTRHNPVLQFAAVSESGRGCICRKTKKEHSGMQFFVSFDAIEGCCQWLPYDSGPFHLALH